VQCAGDVQVISRGKSAAKYREAGYALASSKNNITEMTNRRKWKERTRMRRCGYWWEKENRSQWTLQQ
jgi:hypothetical protein